MENNDSPRTDISSLGEFGLIERLTKEFSLRQASSVMGVGDDAAVIRTDEHLMLVSSDLLMEGIHFDLMYMPLKHLGYKAVVVNLSDIYAMNGTPRQITVNMAISNRFSVEAMEEIYLGIRHACEEYNVDLVGGDTSSSKHGLLISVTAIGDVTEDDICYRSGAKAGDLIVVTGDLGGAYMGLQLLEREKQIFLADPKIQPDLEGQDYIVGRQLKPEARVEMIELLAKLEIKPSSMIDLSDGLSSDLLHLCKASGTGCRIKESDLPIFNETEQMCFTFNMDPTMAALNGGEDYELLFTIRPEKAKLIEEVENMHIIGEMTADPQTCVLESRIGKTHPLIAQGWQHLGDN